MANRRLRARGGYPYLTTNGARSKRGCAGASGCAMISSPSRSRASTRPRTVTSPRGWRAAEDLAVAPLGGWAVHRGPRGGLAGVAGGVPPVAPLPAPLDGGGSGAERNGGACREEAARACRQQGLGAHAALFPALARRD